jgi:phenol 2-monooxygenase
MFLYESLVSCSFALALLITLEIVGAGPAGLMMATWLAKCGIKYRIVDKRNTKLFNGEFSTF